MPFKTDSFRLIRNLWRRIREKNQWIDDTLVFSEDEQKSIVKEYFSNSSSWSTIALDDITDYELQRTMCDPRRFHDLKKFSINIVVSAKLDFVWDTRWTQIKITVTVNIGSYSVLKKRQLIMLLIWTIVMSCPSFRKTLPVIHQSLTENVWR